MKFIKFKNEQESSKYVADLIVKKINHNPKLILGLATGSTPVKLYSLLVENYKTSTHPKTDWSHVKTFNLDEYIGVNYHDAVSYHSFMAKNLFNHVNVNHHNTFFPDPKIDYDELIKENGGIDLQILGIGANGHIGFNEVGSPQHSLTWLVDLVPATIEANAKKYFDGNIDLVPKKALSMGLGSIINAKEIILLAFGASKTEAIKKLKTATKFDINFPASFLVNHKNVTIIVDEGVDVDL